LVGFKEISESKCSEEFCLNLEILTKNIQKGMKSVEYHTTLFIVPDLPIIKVKPLTPRIKPEFLGIKISSIIIVLN
jgi:hypothetical protein